MKALETERLILRKYKESDFDAVHSYGSCVENITYMLFGPNSEDDTSGFIANAIKEAGSSTEYRYAVVLKETDELIGGCDIHLSGNSGEVGWIVHRDHWSKGYGYEMGKRLLEFGFDELNLHRIIAHCDAENIGSYRLMEKLGMRREGLFYDTRPANKQSATGRAFSDELVYAILKSEWETQKEIAYYNTLPFEFNDFIDVPKLTNGEIFLVCTKKAPGDPEKKWIPAYHFAVCKGNEQIGYIDIRIGYGGGERNDNLYYGGQIGYGIDEKYRGKGYAVEACKLLLPVAKAHKMTKLIITNNITNIPSRRVCEKLGAKLLRAARLPEWSDLYQNGERFSNIFDWDVE